MRLTELERRAGGERFVSRPLLARLREVEPHAEFVYVGEGVWWLGTYHPNAKNKAAGLMKMQTANGVSAERQKDPYARRLHRIGQLQHAGLVFLSEHEIQGDPDGALADNLVLMDWLYRTEAYSDHALAHSMSKDKVAAKERAREMLGDRHVAKEAWLDWRRARGTRVTVGSTSRTA